MRHHLVPCQAVDQGSVPGVQAVVVSASDKVMSNRQPPLTADFLIHEAEAISRFVAECCTKNQCVEAEEQEGPSCQLPILRE